MKRIILTSTIFLLFTSFLPLNAQWARTYGGSSEDVARSIQQTSDGGYIVAGYTKSFGAGGSDFWILKLSTTGTIEWQRTYGESDNDQAYSIQQTNDGGYIVAGYTYSLGAGGSDFLVLKLDSDGGIEWMHTYGGSGYDEAYSIQQTSDGGYVVAGSISASSYHGDFGDPVSIYLILKLSPTGEIEWERNYGIGGDTYNKAQFIQQTGDEGYIITGTTGDHINFDSFWILKLDSAGISEWQHKYQISDDWAYSIQQTNDGGYIVAGWSYGRRKSWILKLSSTGGIEWQHLYGDIDGDQEAYSIQQTNDGGYIVAGGTHTFGVRGHDFWVLKLDSDGNIRWQRTYGGSDFEQAYCIQQTNDGGYIVAGYTYSFGAGESDFFILKLFSDGDIDSSCGFIEVSDFIVSDTNISPTNTFVSPRDIDIFPLDTNVKFQETNVTGILLCEASEEENDTLEEDNDSLSESSCLIATAAYGSPLHPHVKILREFRDRYLMPSKIGRVLVDFYYKYSPFVADLIAKYKLLKLGIRISLVPLVAFSYSMAHFGTAISAFMFFFIIVLSIFSIWRFRRKFSV